MDQLPYYSSSCNPGCLNRVGILRELQGPAKQPRVELRSVSAPVMSSMIPMTLFVLHPIGVNVILDLPE
jgi:hypothetical protein